MGKQNFLFVIFCSVLTTSLMLSYFLFAEHFSPEKAQLGEISALKKKLQEKDLRIAQLENQIVDFKQEVATAIPALKNIKKQYQTFQLRSIASVSQKPTESLDLSGALSERAEAEFRRGEFESAAKSFAELARKFPTSLQVVKTHFFWAESLFQAGRKDACLDVIDQMMTLFPDHELTGFIMLRMGQILQERSRPEEAAEVYQVVKKSFSFNSELRAQADALGTAIR